MGDQQHNTVPGDLPQGGKYPLFRGPVQCREGIVQNKHRALVVQSPRQCQPLGLTAGKAMAFRPHQSINAQFHFRNFPVQPHRPQVWHRVFRITHADVFLYGGAEQLRVMAQVAEDSAALLLRQFPVLLSGEGNGTTVGQLTEKRLAQGGFSAGHRPRNTDDLPGFGREAHIMQQLLRPWVGKAQIFHIQCVRCFRGHGFRQFLFLARQNGLDPPPGHLGLMHRVE